MILGTYSRLECCFFFVRSAGFHFVQLFIPATAIVITSWLALWMKRESTFSDMIQVILAITFLYYSYNTVMPKVSYIKAMDIYLGTCFIFVFLSLIKLAVLKYLKSRSAKKTSNSNSLRSTPLLQSRKAYPKPATTVININDNVNGFSPSTPFLLDREISTERNLMNFAISKSATQRRRCCSSVVMYSKNFLLAIFPLLFMGFLILYFIVYFRANEGGDEERCMFGV